MPLHSVSVIKVKKFVLFPHSMRPLEELVKIAERLEHLGCVEHYTYRKLETIVKILEDLELTDPATFVEKYIHITTRRGVIDVDIYVEDPVTGATLVHIPLGFSCAYACIFAHMHIVPSFFSGLLLLHHRVPWGGFPTGHLPAGRSSPETLPAGLTVGYHPTGFVVLLTERFIKISETCLLREFGEGEDSGR